MELLTSCPYTPKNIKLHSSILPLSPFPSPIIPTSSSQNQSPIVLDMVQTHKAISLLNALQLMSENIRVYACLLYLSQYRAAARTEFI